MDEGPSAEPVGSPSDAGQPQSDLDSPDDQDDETSNVETREMQSIERADSQACERLDFVEASLRSENPTKRTCSYLRHRYIGKKGTAFLVPVGGTFFNRLHWKCDLHCSPLLAVSWVPPGWLKSRSINLTASWTSKGRPQLGLRATRRVSHESVCFIAAMNGDVEIVRDLLDSGQASIRDVDISTGYSMLTWAVLHLRTEMVAFLLQEGADPHHEPNGVQPSPSDLAWDLWFRGLISKGDAPKWRPLLDQSDYPHQLDLPLAHGIVLQLSSESLSELWKKDPTAIHKLDAQGRSALSWTAACGLPRDLFALLYDGVNPNTPDNHNKTPLYLAVEYDSIVAFEMVRLLLNFGATPDPVFRYPYPKRSTPMLRAASSTGDLGVLSLLLLYGANANARNRHGETALHIVAKYKSAEHVAVLLGHGARISLKDQEGKTPIDIAIEYGNFDVIQLLMVIYYPRSLPKSTQQAEFEKITMTWDDNGDYRCHPRLDCGYAGPDPLPVPLIRLDDLKQAREQLLPLWFPEEYKKVSAARKSQRLLGLGKLTQKRGKETNQQSGFM